MDSEEYLTVGNLHFSEGRLVKAEESFNFVLTANPENSDALHGLGMVAWMQGDYDKAMRMVEKAISLKSSYSPYLNTKGEILRSCGELDAAELVLLQALSIDPDFAQAHNNLGMVYLSKKEYLLALSRFDSATQLDPNLVMAYFNKGLASKELNQLDAAISAYRQAIALAPDFATAHVNLSIVLLLNGQLKEGFEQYEWRLMPEFATQPIFNCPRWDGLLDPSKTLLVYTEQGYGDVIQFVRYLRFIGAGGMRTIVQCPTVLQGLMQSVEGVAMAYALDEELPAFDAYIPMLSLPFLFQTDLSKIPDNVPYLAAPFNKVQYWGGRLAAFGDTVKIGLRWAGNPHNTQDAERSIPLSVFERLAGLPQATFISLQNTPLIDKEKASAEKLGLVEVSDELHDFVDTLALIENLNLVISVDTAVMHLAGALGRPVWGLQKYAPHWPWMLERDDSPWYPSMRLFRQQTRGDWDLVLEWVAGVLREVMDSVQEE